MTNKRRQQTSLFGCTDIRLIQTIEEWWNPIADSNFLLSFAANCF
jgi:hypothetical protein